MARIKYSVSPSQGVNVYTVLVSEHFFGVYKHRNKNIAKKFAKRMARRFTPRLVKKLLAKLDKIESMSLKP